MAKKRKNIKTRSRSLYLPKNKIMDEWFNNQDNAGVSINNGIILKIEEYGIKDYPLAIAESYATTDKKLKDKANIGTQESYSKVQTTEKQQRSSALYNEGPVLEWIEAQTNLSSSIGLLITDLIAQYGTSDLPLRLAWLSGRRNKCLNELSTANIPEKDDDDVPLSNEEVERQSESTQVNNAPDLFSEEGNERSLGSEKVNSEKSDSDEEKIDLSILHDKSFFNNN